MLSYLIVKILLTPQIHVFVTDDDFLFGAACRSWLLLGCCFLPLGLGTKSHLSYLPPCSRNVTGLTQVRLHRVPL